MPTTSPDNIYYPDSTTALALETNLAQLASSVQDALDDKINDTRQIQTFVWANAAARAAQTGMTGGDMGYQLDTNERYLYTGTAWIVLQSSGLVPVVPSSVAGTSVTLNATTGVVSWSGSASTVSVNGCFTSAFTNYLIQWDNTAASATMNVRFRLRAAGTDSTGSNYGHEIITGSGGVVSSGTSGTTTSWQCSADTSSTAFGVSGEIRVFNPALAIRTRGILDATTFITTASLRRASVAAGHDLTTAYNGFTMFPSSGTWSGTLKVYGYN